jgi:hypothetical protein
MSLSFVCPAPFCAPYPRLFPWHRQLDVQREMPIAPIIQQVVESHDDRLEVSA